MIIIGAGMSGMLAANMLKRHNPTIFEAASSLPNNHAALLRFRTDAVEKATGIKLRKVFVQKAVLVHPDGQITNSPSIQLQNMYSMKVTGEIKQRSIINLEAGERYIAPDDFCEELAKGCDIKYNEKLTKESAIGKTGGVPTTISTIPMPELMKIMGWSDFPKFEYREIHTINAKIKGMNCDVYQTIYCPHLSMDVYRVSITGDMLIIERMMKENQTYFEGNAPAECKWWLQHFLGATGSSRVSVEEVKCKHQKYGKLLPLDGATRKQFILAMTDIHNIYSLGRFATWRQILMDDVVNDVNVIKTLIEERDGYAKKIKYSAGN